MKEASEAVIAFNQNLIGIPPREEIGPLSKPDFEWLMKALEEEFKDEFGEAFHQQDVVKMVDALCDGIYFAIGGFYKMGLTADQIHACFMHVHEKNMQKIAGKVEKRAVEGTKDALKPAGFVPAEVEIAKILGFDTE